MAELASPDDVAAAWRPLSTEEMGVAETLIEQASAKLRVEVPNIDSVAVEGSLKAQLAKTAIVNAVKRVLQNPDGWLSQSFGIDDYREENRRDSALSTGALYIDPADLKGLVARGRGFGTIRLGSAL